jgi:pSer/pThr/pTyr-binding forkhead associated (FHA) protein
MALLVRIIEGPSGHERVLTFDRSPVHLGRNPGNELLISEPFVSGRHARIDFTSIDVTVTDLGSTNGTSFNGERLPAHTPTRLTSAGDVVQIGAIRITFGFTGTAESAEPPPLVHFADPSGGHKVDLGVRVGEGTGAPERFLTFDSSPVRIGRNKLNEIVFEQPFVSQWHALARFQGASITVMDLGSTNGTIVNGQRLQPQTPMPLMSPADTVQIGSIRLRFEPVVRSEPAIAEPSFVTPGAYESAEDTMFLFNVVDWLGELRGLSKGTEMDAARVRPLMRRVAQLLQTFSRSFVELRDGFEHFGSEMGLKTTVEHTPLNAVKTQADLLEYLLDQDVASDERVGELKRAYTDLALHQVALLNGVMAGVRELLQDLAPEKRWGTFSASSVLTEIEKKRQALLDEDRFARVVFGRSFSRAYFAVTGQKDGDG